MSLPGPSSSEDDVPPDAPVTLDGVRVRLLLEINDRREAADVAKLGADGVCVLSESFLQQSAEEWETALMRSDFFGGVAVPLHDSPSDSTDECYRIYRQVADALENGELAVRLADTEEGFRQPQALARLGRERPLTVLMPMLDSPGLFKDRIDLLCQSAGCGQRTEVPFKFGALVASPVAAVQIGDVLPFVDSVSIVLNDVARLLPDAGHDDDRLERQHEGLQPATLNLLAQAIAASYAQYKPVTLCGNLAGDSNLTGLWLALGLRRLSVPRSSYRGIINSITHLSVRSMTGIGAEVLKLTTAAQLRKYVAERLTGP